MIFFSFLLQCSKLGIVSISKYTFPAIFSEYLWILHYCGGKVRICLYAKRSETGQFQSATKKEDNSDIYQSVEGCCVARHCAKFSRNLKHSRVNPVPKLEEEEETVVMFDVFRSFFLDKGDLCL
jgi:hypothetical protein